MNKLILLLIGCICVATGLIEAQTPPPSSSIDCSRVKCGGQVFKECPDRYQFIPKGQCCPQCQGPNCGGFAGTQCTKPFQVCWHADGHDAGYCVFSEEIPSTGFTDPPLNNQPPPNNGENCAGCPRMNPVCPTCPAGKVCKTTPTSCHQCAKAECVEPAECVVCPKMMPVCTMFCEKGMQCGITQQTCSSCPQAICQPIPELNPLLPPLPIGNVAGQISPTPPSTGPVSCVKCPETAPFCPDCVQGKVCKVTPGNCTQCAKAECVSPDQCIACPKSIPGCNLLCVRGKECVVTEQTCGACPTAVCRAIEPVSPPSPPGENCVICTMDIPRCPECSRGQRCVIEPQSCQVCSKAVCK